MYNLVIFGGPGSGKGTQSEIIVKEFGFLHISTGDVLRNEIKKGTETGKFAEELMSKGQFVPDQVIIKMLENVLDNEQNARGVIFDGFPRTIAQAEALDVILKERNYSVSKVVALEVDDSILSERLVLRGKMSGRSDDNEETIKTRIQVYHNVTAPLIEFYKNAGKYIGINGEGTIDEIAQRIKKVIQD